MSRSCQSATFSSPTSAAPRTTRASPQIRSATTGFRLCGIADEPFWPVPNGSSTSRTSVRARCRISSAKRVERRGRDARAPRAARRGGRAGGSGSRTAPARGPSRSHASRSTSGSVAAYVPTAPESLPTRRPSSARSTRVAVAVELERPARELEAERRRLGVHAVRAPDRERVAVLLGPRDDRVERAVEPGEDQPAGLLDLERRARCRRRPTRSARSGTSGPPRRGRSATASTNAARSWCVRASISRTRSGVGAFARARIASAASRGTRPSSAHASSAASSTSSQRSSLLSSDQTRAIAGREYRAITRPV